MNKIKVTTKLTACIIESELLKDFIGKEVEICIREVNSKPKTKYNWTQLGALDLGGKLDNVNLRDYAHK